VSFDLLRIFLQQASVDFTFVKSFLDQVSLAPDQKRHVMERFFAIFSSEGTEETKVLSIQLLVLPMLKSEFESKGVQKIGQPNVTCSWAEKVLGENNRQGETEHEGARVEEKSVIDKAILHKFIDDVLFQDGTPRCYGGRLNVELLKMSNLLLKYRWEDLVRYRKDLIKFSWNLLKSDDIVTKHWAYINVCQFIAVFETPDRIVLQVYVALLRSFQQEAKDLVRLAFNILMPSLARRLTVENYHKAVRFTTKIMYEEGSSVPQLAHLWQVIIMHPYAFEKHRHLFLSQMVTSLSRLALPTSCPLENRETSISLVALILDWSTVDDERVRAGDETVTLTESCSLKKLKSNDGSPVSLQSLEETEHRRGNKCVTATPEQREAVMNFLVRLLLVIADGKGDPVQREFASRGLALFRRALSVWPLTPINTVYLDQMLPKPSFDKKSKDKASKNKAGSSKSKLGSSKGTGSRLASFSDVKPKVPILLTCLDIFAAIHEFAPQNNLTDEYSPKISSLLSHCFEHAKDNAKLREHLQTFVVNLLCSSQMPCCQIVLNINVLVEAALINAARAEMDVRGSGYNGKSGSGRKGKKEDLPKDEKQSDVLKTASFVVQVIDTVCMNRPEYVENFTGALLGLAEILVKKQGSAASNKSVASTKHSVGGIGFHRQLSSPSLGIFEEALGICFSNCGKRPSFPDSKEAGVGCISVSEVDADLLALISTIRLLGSSHLPSIFSDNRTAYLNLLHDILDTSSNIHLLITTVAVVGKLLLSERANGPMSTKERNCFLLKITSFDTLQMAESVKQPLADLVAQIILSFHCWDGSVSAEVPTGSHNKEGFNAQQLSIPPRSSLKFKHHTDVDDESGTVLMGRCLVSCLLSANPRLRPLLVGLFGTQATDCIVMERFLLKRGECAGCTQFDSLDAVGVPFRTPVDLLWQLLGSDYEGLAGRLWTIIFVEFLIGVSNHRGGVELSHSKHRNTANEENPNASNAAWLPKPVLAQSDNAKILRNLGAEYVDFCKELSDQKRPSCAGRGRCLAAVRRIAHVDVSLSQGLLERLLSFAWAKLPSNKARRALVSAIEPLLCQSYHVQFLQHSHTLGGRTYAVPDPMKSRSLCVNPVQSILRGIASLQPLPAIDTDILIGNFSLYNGWFEVISMLEQQHRVISAKSADDKAYHEKLIALIHLCFRDLGEADVCMSMSFNSCKLPQSKYALSLELYGKVQHAMENYTDLIAKSQEASKTFESTASSSATEVPSDVEAGVWEDRWVDLNRELCQWEVLSEYAEDMAYPKLQMESAWKLREWDKVRKLLATPSIMGLLEDGDPDIKMSEVFLAIVDGKLTDVENLHAQTAQLCLYKWQLLPSLSTGSNAHVSLLQKFHRLVELRESGQIMVETSTHSSGRTFPDLKNLLTAWRHRLPNEADPISVWDDVFIWRSHMFNAITTNFSWSEPGTLATLHDRPWTAIRLASVGRKQGTKEVSLLSLGKLTDCAMDVSDAFSKLREQIMSYCGGSDLERTGGLNLINTTNLSFFDSRQKSELFRLKAKFLSTLGQPANANQAFCHALHVCPSYSRAWVDWGGLCSSLSEQLEGVSKTTGDATKAQNAARKVYQYLSQAMACYLEAMQCDTHEMTRINIPKCLWMLSKEGVTPGLLCNTLETRGDLPAWVWLPWIPQLLTSLYRVEGKVVKGILKGILARYPQALYPHLRVFFLERREVEKPRSPAGQQLHNSVTYSDELMVFMRKTHAALYNCLEPMLEELIVRFRPTHEEELLNPIKNLLQKAEAQLEQHKQGKGGSLKTADDALLSHISKTVQRIINARFFRIHSETAQRAKDDRTKRAIEFTARFKERFEKDFIMSSVDSSDSTQLRQRVGEVAEKLKKWKRMLEIQVDSTPHMLALQQASPTLASFAAEAPDLWAGACDPFRDSSHEQRLEHDGGIGQASPSSSAAAAAEAARAASKAVAMAAAKEGCGGHYGGGATAIEIPGQYPPHRDDAIDSRPSPELHVKLVRFESSVRVTKRSGYVAHRIGMVGSDGKTRYFLLQYSIHHWTHADERTTQLHYLCSKIFRRNVVSSRRNLFARPSPVLPLAQRFKMTADDNSCYSLGYVYSRHCAENGLDSSYPSKLFHEEVSSGLKRLSDAGEGARTADSEKSVKVAAFQKVRECVKPNILSRWISSLFKTQEELYHFRQIFCSQTAVNSLLQYGFGVIERTPAQFVFSIQTGQVYAPDFRFAYSPHGGYLQGTGIPFRMTPNIQDFMGPFLMQGRFIPAFSSAAMGICAYERELDPILRLLLRDDIVSWYTSKASPRSDSKMQELERQLVDRQIRKNTSLVQGRLRECSPKDAKVEAEKEATQQEPVDQRLRDLIASATATDSLGTMPNGFQAWL